MKTTLFAIVASAALNGEWIPTDTPLSPGLVYRIKPNPTTEE